MHEMKIAIAAVALVGAAASMPTRNVNLTERLERFIQTGITSGRFSNASEVVREGRSLAPLLAGRMA